MYYCLPCRCGMYCMSVFPLINEFVFLIEGLGIYNLYSLQQAIQIVKPSEANLFFSRYEFSWLDKMCLLVWLSNVNWTYLPDFWKYSMFNKVNGPLTEGRCIAFILSSCIFVIYVSPYYRYMDKILSYEFRDHLNLRSTFIASSLLDCKIKYAFSCIYTTVANPARAFQNVRIPAPRVKQASL